MIKFTPRQIALLKESNYLYVSAHYTNQGELRVKFEAHNLFKGPGKLGTFTAPWDYSLNTANEVAFKHLNQEYLTKGEGVEFTSFGGTPRAYMLGKLLPTQPLF